MREGQIWYRVIWINMIRNDMSTLIWDVCWIGWRIANIVSKSMSHPRGFICGYVIMWGCSDELLNWWILRFSIKRCILIRIKGGYRCMWLNIGNEIWCNWVWWICRWWWLIIVNNSIGVLFPSGDNIRSLVGKYVFMMCVIFRDKISYCWHHIVPHPSYHFYSPRKHIFYLRLKFSFVYLKCRCISHWTKNF